MQNRQDLLFPLKSTSQIPAEEERFPSRAINARASDPYTKTTWWERAPAPPSPRPPPAGPLGGAQGRARRPLAPRADQGHWRGREARSGTGRRGAKSRGPDFPGQLQTDGRKPPLRRERERRNAEVERPRGDCGPRCALRARPGSSGEQPREHWALRTRLPRGPAAPSVCPRLESGRISLRPQRAQSKQAAGAPGVPGPAAPLPARGRPTAPRPRTPARAPYRR